MGQVFIYIGIKGLVVRGLAIEFVCLIVIDYLFFPLLVEVIVNLTIITMVLKTGPDWPVSHGFGSIRSPASHVSGPVRPIGPEWY